MQPSRGGVENRSAFDAPETIAQYASASGLTTAERHLFDRYLWPGMSILDVGVGSGRTSTHLSAIAGRYVGADISPAMVDVARARFPHLEFVVADAAALDRIGTGEFDGIVFSFNGIDCLYPDARRHEFLGHAHRIIGARGRLIFSHHNAADVVVLPRRFEGDLRHRVDLLRYAGRETLRALSGRLSDPGTWNRRDRYVIDRSIGDGLLMHVATRQGTIDETVAHGFALLEVIRADFPRRLPSLAVEFWYHAYLRV